MAKEGTHWLEVGKTKMINRVLLFAPSKHFWGWRGYTMRLTLFSFSSWYSQYNLHYSICFIYILYFILEIKKCVVKICGWLGVKPGLPVRSQPYLGYHSPSPTQDFQGRGNSFSSDWAILSEESQGAPSTWLPERERRLNGHHHKFLQIYHAGRGELWSDPGLGVAAFECHPQVRVCVTLGATFSKKFPPKIQVGGWCVSEQASMDTSKSLGSQILSWEGKGDTTTERNPTP